MSEPPLRQAASVLAGRDGPAGLELLVVERGRESRFLPRYVAFPGGSEEPGDAQLARAWFADEAQALRATAVRELVEEAGLALTADGLVDAGDPDSLDPVHSAPPTLDQLPEVARWVAPERIPVRFDARYFAIAAPGELEPAPDGAETAHAWWESPRSLLEGWEAGTRKLFWPTYFTMLQLAPLVTVSDLLGLRF
ncbi:MAG TPA: NUDIX domain-containing protein, partial [Methylomirabilota bacterium]|nr:NUDIX domain-containing protein [Methylomirabilota bacterium]